jgi:hypothetical protein
MVELDARHLAGLQNCKTHTWALLKVDLRLFPPIRPRHALALKNYQQGASRGFPGLPDLTSAILAPLPGPPFVPASVPGQDLQRRQHLGTGDQQLLVGL